MELLEKVRAACFHFDTNKSGEIDVTELSKGLQNADIHEHLVSLFRAAPGPPHHHELFHELKITQIETTGSRRARAATGGSTCRASGAGPTFYAARQLREFGRAATRRRWRSC